MKVLYIGDFVYIHITTYKPIHLHIELIRIYHLMQATLDSFGLYLRHTAHTYQSILYDVMINTIGVSKIL